MRPTTLIIYILLVLVPSAPLFATWYGMLKRDSRGTSVPSATALLVVTTASCVFFLVGLFHQNAIGPDYSTRRFVTIYSNLGVANAVGLTVLLGKHQQKEWIAGSAGAVALVWLYLAIVSSVV